MQQHPLVARWAGCRKLAFELADGAASSRAGGWTMLSAAQ